PAASSRPRSGKVIFHLSSNSAAFPPLFSLKSGKPAGTIASTMNPYLTRLQALFGNGAAKALMAPAFIVMVLAMMVLPLPAFVLDLAFTFNIAMALMVMMVAAQMVRPLDFAAFPAVLLITTLLRLSLNVASARVVLLQGHTGTAAAGRGSEGVGHVLIGVNFARRT